MGNSQSGEDVAFEVLKKVGSVALAVSYFTPAAAITGPMTVVGGVTGLGMEIAGEAMDNDELKKAGSLYRGMAIDAGIDGIAGGALEGAKTCGKAAKWLKMGCEAYNNASDDFHRATGKPFIPTPDPQTTLYVAKNIKYMF
ncbi:1570_t:CDS:1 [Paraglomus occultum]|uniref:1570_t:CDS:1 n=1 Tax=Paraglomus occultum TaxID=144539 RepID=A0A9N8W8X2_9GLOM|nr:1570_t:CDS:1 [Paraglomus occultum]